MAAAHNTQLSRQIGEQLLGAICLTSQIVEAGEKDNRTSLPLILTEDLVSAMEPVDSVLASKDIQIAGARAS